MAGTPSSNAESIKAIEQALLSHENSRIVGSYSAPVSDVGLDGKVNPIIDMPSRLAFDCETRCC